MCRFFRTSIGQLLLLVGILCTLSSTSTSTSCGPRVRRNWGALNATEKQLYVDAVNASISLGYHAYFVEVHSEVTSLSESLYTCAMTFWHRRFLLAYENMLRSLEPRFACITIPYWDFFADYAKRQNGLCTTLETCSPILNDLGSFSGPAANVTINGFTASGNCVASSPFDQFCQGSTTPPANCSHCIPRDDWGTKDFPCGFGYASLARLLSLSFGFAWFHQNVHYGVHNAMHNALGSTMATLATAADPIFFNHHATVDLIHQLFLECQVGRTMTENEKQTSSYAFQQCALSSSFVCPSILSNVTQVWQAVGQPQINADDHPILGQFFSPLPRQYWHYVDASDMGNHSYTYESDDLFLQLENNAMVCPRNQTRRRLQAWGVGTSDAASEAIARTSALFDDVIGQVMVNKPSFNDALEEVELMECLYHDSYLGGVKDFTDTFKRNFGLPSGVHTRCTQLLAEHKHHQRTISFTNWQDRFKQYLEDWATTTV